MTEEDPTAIEPESEVEPDTLKLLVTDQRGSFIIDLPPGYRVTFGAVNPGAQVHARDLHCLRVWDGPGKTARLRAVFCDVRGIRDLSIPFARKVERETGSASWSRDDLGNFSAMENRQIEASIVEDDF